jgi:hypothetical protein
MPRSNLDELKTPGLAGRFLFSEPDLLFAVAEATRPPSRAAGLAVASPGIRLLIRRGSRGRRGLTANGGFCRVALGIGQEAHLFAHG